MDCIVNIPHLGTCIHTLYSRSESAHSLLFLSTSCPQRFCINNNCSLLLLYFHAATSHLQRGDQLQHITEFGANPQPVDPTSRPLAPMLLSCGLPPVPTKLIKRIQDDLFIEMFELLPERLISADYNAGNGTGTQKQKPQEDLLILQWIQYFGIYIAIIS